MWGAESLTLVTGGKRQSFLWGSPTQGRGATSSLITGQLLMGIPGCWDNLSALKVLTLLCSVFSSGSLWRLSYPWGVSCLLKPCHLFGPSLRLPYREKEGPLALISPRKNSPDASLPRSQLSRFEFGGF